MIQPFHLSKEIKYISIKKLCLNVHRNIIYNSSKPYTTQISTNRQMDWRNLSCHLYKGILLSSEKTLNNDMYNNEKFQTKKEIRQEKLNSLDSRKCRTYLQWKKGCGWLRSGEKGRQKGWRQGTFEGQSWQWR